MGVRIITDSASDFEAAVAKRRKIDIVPMTIQFGSAAFLAGKTLSNDVFYQLLQEGRENPSTSQPAPAAFLQLFEEARRDGDQVVVILLSGVLSGTMQSAMIAKGMCGYEPIYIIDSLTVSAGIQILVNYACKLRDQAQARHRRPGRQALHRGQVLRHGRGGQAAAENSGGSPGGRRLPLLFPLHGG